MILFGAYVSGECAREDVSYEAEHNGGDDGLIEI